MNKGFGNYLWGLIRRALNTVDEVIEAYAKALGYIYDSLKEAAYRVRRSWYIRTCSEDALYERGEERKLRRYPGESLEQYKNRLNSAIEIYSEGGTIPGMQRLLERLGYPDAVIYELYKDGDVPTLYNGQSRYDGRRIYDTENRWAEFKITTRIERNATLRKVDYALLIELVNKAKPGHSRLAAFNIKVEFSERLTWPDNMALRARQFAEEEIELIEIVEVTKRKVIDLQDYLPGATYYLGDIRYDGENQYMDTGIGDSLNIKKVNKNIIQDEMETRESIYLEAGHQDIDEVDIEEEMQIVKTLKPQSMDIIPGSLFYRGDATYDGDLTYGSNEINESLNITLRRL